MNFIKLTEVGAGKPVFVNVDTVAAFGQWEGTINDESGDKVAGTSIWSNVNGGTSPFIVVKETFPQVVEQLATLN